MTEERKRQSQTSHRGTVVLSAPARGPSGSTNRSTPGSPATASAARSWIPTEASPRAVRRRSGFREEARTRSANRLGSWGRGSAAAAPLPGCPGEYSFQGASGSCSETALFCHRSPKQTSSLLAEMSSLTVSNRGLTFSLPLLALISGERANPAQLSAQERKLGSGKKFTVQ